MDCIKCKKPLQDDFIYCPYCGKKQVSEKAKTNRMLHKSAFDGFVQ